MIFMMGVTILFLAFSGIVILGYLLNVFFSKIIYMQRKHSKRRFTKNRGGVLP